MSDTQSFAIWFTGLSGAGKSTLAEALQVRLKDMGLVPYILNGDVLRTGLNSDLGFSDEDRVENLRRVGEVGGVLLDAGVVTLAAFITPFVAERNTFAPSSRRGVSSTMVRRPSGGL